MLALLVELNLGVVAMKEYSTFPKVPGLEPHHQIVLCHNQNTGVEGSYLSAEMQSVYSTTSADWIDYIKSVTTD